MLKHTIALLLALLSLPVLLLCGCEKKELQPALTYPLSKESVTEIIEEAGLEWTIVQNMVDTEHSVFSFHRPEDPENYPSVLIRSFSGTEPGPRLMIEFIEKQDRDRAVLEEPTTWEDYAQILRLVPKLYGGFKAPDVLYDTCAATPIPTDKRILWSGPVNGSYVFIKSNELLDPSRFFRGNFLRFLVYGSEEDFMAHREQTSRAED